MGAILRTDRVNVAVFRAVVEVTVTGAGVFVNVTCWVDEGFVTVYGGGAVVITVVVVVVVTSTWSVHFVKHWDR